VRFGRLILSRLRGATPEAEVVRWYGWVAEYAEALRSWDEQHALARALPASGAGRGAVCAGRGDVGGGVGTKGGE